MKRVEAIIKPFKLESVEEALKEIGINGMTIYEVKGMGRQHGHTELYRGAEYEVSYVPKIKIELFCSDEKVEEIVRTIKDSAVTGKIGDGKIIISEIDNIFRIRTGESGIDAIE